jgi:Cu2+-containing amine oxidase
MAYKVHTYTGSSLHDHTYGFKVDLDVGTMTNSFRTIDYKMGSTLDAVNEQRAELGETVLSEKPTYLLFNKMRYVTETTVQDEESARMNINPAQPKTWIFGDSTNVNKWGNMRAYHLSLDQSPQVVVDNDHYTMPAFSFAKQMLAVTKYKDSEETLTGAYDLNRLANPQGPFDNMVNGESIVQEDLVAWVTLSSFHLPTSENIPMVNVMTHGFTLKPWNFFDENPTMDMPHYLRMHPGENPGDDRSEDPPVAGACVPRAMDTSHEFSGV